jgi:hypothetical protein
MQYQIETVCSECNGRGVVEDQLTVDRFEDIECPQCHGIARVFCEEYDSLSDVTADYPQALITAMYPTTARDGFEIGLKLLAR